MIQLLAYLLSELANVMAEVSGCIRNCDGNFVRRVSLIRCS